MAGPPRRFGMLTPPPAAVAELPTAMATSFRNVGWLAGNPDDQRAAQQVGPGWVFNATPQVTPQVPGPPTNPAAYRVASRQITLYNDPPELPFGTMLFRLQSIVRKAPTQFGTDAYALGHYSPFKTGGPGLMKGAPVAAEMRNSDWQPISRGGHVLVSITESNYEGGPGAAARRFANTRFGLWFKAWVIGGANIRPLGTQQTPSPQFRGVLPNYGYVTLPRVIGQ